MIPPTREPSDPYYTHLAVVFLARYIYIQYPICLINDSVYCIRYDFGLSYYLLNARVYRI